MKTIDNDRNRFNLKEYDKANPKKYKSYEMSAEGVWTDKILRKNRKKRENNGTAEFSIIRGRRYYPQNRLAIGICALADDTSLNQGQFNLLATIGIRAKVVEGS